MKRAFQILAVFVAVLGPALGSPRPAFSQATVDARLDKRIVSVDDTLTLSVTVRGGEMTTTPDIPSQGNFDVVGRSMGTSIEIVNGRMSATKTFHYELSPRAPGDFTIGPIKVYMEGEEYTAGPLAVKVTDSTVPRTYQNQSPGQAQPGYGFPFPQHGMPGIPGMQEEPPPSAHGETRDTFLTVETDKKTAYVGQQVLYTFRLYSAVSIQGAQLTLPDFKDFITEELAKERKFQVDMGGRRYMVNEWRLALFPTKPGTLTTGKTEVKANVPVQVSSPFGGDPFFQGMSLSFRPKTFSGESLSIEVKALPPGPDDFIGLVGHFTLASSLSKTELDLGETANWKVELSGKGNIREATLPKLADIPNFKVYPDQPSVKVEKSLTGLEGKKTFNYALVAERPGTAVLPALQMSFFNPDSSAYEQLSTEAVTVAVKGSPSQEKLVSAGLQADGSASGSGPQVRDLKPIEGSASVLRNKTLGKAEAGVAWAVFLGAPAAYLFLLLGIQFKERHSARSQDRKRSRAFRKAKQALMKVEGLGDGQGFSGVSGIVREYLGDRFAVAGRALTPLEIEELLVKKGIPAEGVRKLIYLLEQLDSWQYGGIHAGLPPEKELKHEILDILRDIEKQI